MKTKYQVPVAPFSHELANEWNGKFHEQDGPARELPKRKFTAIFIVLYSDGTWGEESVKCRLKKVYTGKRTDGQRMDRIVNRIKNELSGKLGVYLVISNGRVILREDTWCYLK